MVYEIDQSFDRQQRISCRMPIRKKAASAGRAQSGDATRLRIIESAELLFADNGYEGTSLRGIMAHAGVSISLISYHFGNKEGLLRAIFEQKAEPLNKQRLEWIQATVAAKPVPDLEELLRGYFLPSFRDSMMRKRRPDHFMRLVSRIGSDRSEIARNMMREFFDEFQREFIAALRRALPYLCDEDLYWRLHCLLCIITHTMNNPRRIYDLSGGLCDFTQVDYAFDHLLPFLLEGLRAPAPRDSVGRPSAQLSRKAVKRRDGLVAPAQRRVAAKS
jgi:AcrR family transcriptional regulator